ncbi:IS110 family transposase [Bosea sp. F3-2]|jgi:transposase|uniref:IS110 family transposase n=1 Tax=Bosea sp. F3-2 TaxID=2599640 RepID=UPI0011EC9852|nr:IS110 family transposase [Bosea sp. F3-2]QEL22970.1 IS110 family transposase [Bosea sp. F3-2]QEL24360.1 IS110 family transposase [Bosea sp. F3-2]QEL26247.1 IS110 family transposase [Bosea sp. F3-2]QEL26665.1 IS110 family transposase [Bosea sp. F3-2]
MSQSSNTLGPVHYDGTLVLAIELSSKSWVLAAQIPGLPQTRAKRTIDPDKLALQSAIDGYRARAAAAGHSVDRVIATYEAGWSGFWLARWLIAMGVEVHVIQPSSVPVDRRMRRAKSDGIDAELLLRTLLAWLRGEPRVCSMVPIPDEVDEDARRCVRERTELVSERVGLVNRIGAVLATLGAGDYNPLLQNRRRRLAELRTGLGKPLPPNALAKIERLLTRLELVIAQMAELERDRDAVAEAVAPDEGGKMIQQLCSLRGIGVQSATVLVREAFVRRFANGKALGSYAGLAATPYSSGGIEREQGIGKAGNRRLRTVMVELAWLWQRYQPGTAQVAWFRDRVGSTGRRVRKVMVVALARKLLIALWRFVIDGIVPEGAIMKPSA